MVGVLVIELVRVTRLGRILRTLADSPTATESVVVNPTALPGHRLLPQRLPGRHRRRGERVAARAARSAA